MTQANDLQQLTMAIGRLEGRMGEAIHTANNTAQKVDALAEKVAINTNLPARVEVLENRVDELKAAENRRAGVMGFGGWLLSILPASAIAAIVTTLFEFFRGKS